MAVSRLAAAIAAWLQADHIRFPELPGNLYTRPTLIWTLGNDGSTKHRVEAAYLAGRLSWSADYVLTVGSNDASADLDGWVTLANNSGTSFRRASLQLVAGNLNRVQNAMTDMLRRQAPVGCLAAAWEGAVARLPWAV